MKTPKPTSTGSTAARREDAKRRRRQTKRSISRRTALRRIAEFILACPSAAHGRDISKSNSPEPTQTSILSVDDLLGTPRQQPNNERDCVMSEGRITSSIRKTLDDLDLKYDSVQDRGFIFSVGGPGNTGPLEIRISVNEEGDYAVFLAALAIRANVSDAAQTDAVVELVDRINWRLTFGSFKIDLNDGELVHECTMNYDGLDNIPEDLNKLGLFEPARLWENLAPAFLAVLFGGKSAREALDDLKGSDRNS